MENDDNQLEFTSGFISSALCLKSTIINDLDLDFIVCQYDTEIYSISPNSETTESYESIFSSDEKIKQISPISILELKGKIKAKRDNSCK